MTIARVLLNKNRTIIDKHNLLLEEMKELNINFTEQNRKAADVDFEMGELELALRNAQNEAAEAKY